ncbi:MAG TPA: hypothetical protein VHY08_13585 [Bacillota bacterium]|nr:hypothetical protein [Bacillota bacterium]
MKNQTYDRKGEFENLNEPAFLRVSPVNIKGTPANRLMIIVKSNGCEYAHRKEGGCTMCGFANHLNGRVTEAQLLNQIDFALKTVDLTEVMEINFFTIGSIFNDHELSLSFREQALQKMAALPQIKRITIEGRAEYVTVEKLRQCKKIVGDKILEYGIGFETVNDYLRNSVVKKNLSKEAFINLLRMAKEANVEMYVYLLIKPFGLTEKEAIEDAVQSAEYVFKMAREIGVYARVAFEPIFIVQNTELEKAFERGEYQLANLWTVVEVLRRTAHLGEIFVGLSDEKLSSNRSVFSCQKCNEKLKDAIEAFNKTQERSIIDQLDCECRDNYLKKIS